MSQCVCDPLDVDGYTYIQWIGTAFGDCVYTPLDQAGFSFGLISIFFWCICMFPQIWENYKRKKADALSLAFLCAWLCGDITNLVGCILTDQLPFQLYTAIYFLACDVAILSQYALYNYLYPKWEKESISVNREVDRVYSIPAFLVFVALQGGAYWLLQAEPNQGFRTNRTLLVFDDAPICDAPAVLSEQVIWAGYAISWLSCICYWFSRVPQIVTNYHRRSVQGLSISMFILTISANITYGLQILLRKPPVNSAFWGAVLPYIVGSIGTLIWDAILMFQFYFYNRGKRSEYERL